MPVSQEVALVRWEAGCQQRGADHVAAEAMVRLHVNGQELARMMCSTSGCGGGMTFAEWTESGESA